MIKDDEITELRWAGALQDKVFKAPYVIAMEKNYKERHAFHVKAAPLGAAWSGQMWYLLRVVGKATTKNKKLALDLCYLKFPPGVKVKAGYEKS